MLRFGLLITAAIVVSAPAMGQRPAVSSYLSPEAAGHAFRRAVVAGCVQAVSGSGICAVAAACDGRLHPTPDAETRLQAAAPPPGICESTVQAARDTDIVTVQGTVI